MVRSQFRYLSQPRPPMRPVQHHSSGQFDTAKPDHSTPRLVACVDDGEQANAVSSQALAIACSLGLEITFARVIEAPTHLASPADPIEWQLHRRTQSESLRRFADQEEEAKVAANSVLLAGVPADELSDWAQDHGATMLVMGQRKSDRGKGLGSTAQALLDRAEHSLLLVPPCQPHKGSYRRVMVPIDGSARADSVLPIARRIARTHAADLVLVHIVPQLEVVGASRAPQVEQLRAQIDRHNKRNGIQHLEQLRRRSLEDGVEVKTIICGPGDPRSMLRDRAIEEQVDLIVMASHGNTGLEDVAVGSVAEYLAGHAPVPLLIVRPNIQCSFGSDPTGSRNDSVFRFEE